MNNIEVHVYGTKKRAILLNLADQCCTASLKVHPISLNFIKLLIHLARGCINNDEVTCGITYCDLLWSTLTAESIAEGSKDLLVCTFSILSKAAYKLDKLDYPKEDVLQVRKRALQCLLRSCQEFEALLQIMKAEKLYLQSTSPPTPQQISVLNVFHADLVPTPQDVFHRAKMSCDEFLTGAQYLHRRVILAGKDGMLNELYADVISKHRTLCGGWCKAQETSLKVGHPPYPLPLLTLLPTVPYSLLTVPSLPIPLLTVPSFTLPPPPPPPPPPLQSHVVYQSFSPNRIF